MRDVRVVLKTPAGEGNTCYRPETDTSGLHDLIAKSLKRLDPDLEFSFEVVVTESEEQLLINDRPLREWTEGLDETHHHHYHESVRPAIASGRYTVLEERGFLDAVLESVIKQS